MAEYLGRMSPEDFQRMMDETDPELKAFAQSLRGLPEEERVQRIQEWLDARYPEDAPHGDT